jgi:hypothetical protein
LTIKEFTINEAGNDVLAAIYQQQPQILCFPVTSGISASYWNSSKTTIKSPANRYCPRRSRSVLRC